MTPHRKPTRRQKYAAAAERVKSGAWTVDPTRGLVFGRNGKPIGFPAESGYVLLGLWRGGGREAGRPCHVMAHRVIWESVHGPIPHGLEVNHRNKVRTDNRIANLELVTPSENCRHRDGHQLVRNTVPL